MKKHFVLALLVGIAWGIMALLSEQGKADTGHEGAVRKEMGSYTSRFLVSPSSFTPTQMFSASIKRVDGYCFNNSSVEIWISTDTTAMTGANGPRPAVAITNGTAIMSSGTYRLEGSFTGGDDYAVCGGGAATCQLRCEEKLVR